MTYSTFLGNGLGFFLPPFFTNNEGVLLIILDQY